MNSFTLLYFFYGAKLGSQASIYFIWLVDSSSRTIAFIGAAVAVFAIFPFFHVIVHIFSAKPLSNPTFIAYLCFSLLLAILWYEPTQDGEQRVLPFAVVTTFDLLTLFIFLFQRQIGHWHVVLTSDIEQGHSKARNTDDASMTPVIRHHQQIEHRGFGARPETSQSEIHRLQAMQEEGYNINTINNSRREVASSVGEETIRVNPRSVDRRPGEPAASGRGTGQEMDSREANGMSTSAEAIMWPVEMVRPMNERHEAEEGGPDLELNQPERQTAYFIDSGMETVDTYRVHSSLPVEKSFPDVPSSIHPAFRGTFHNVSQLGSHDGFQTPKETSSPLDPSPLETGSLKLNQI